MDRNRDLSPYLLLVLTTLFWSGNFVLARYVRLDVPPIALSFWRWAVAALLLLPFIWGRLSWQTLGRHFWLILVLALLSVTNFNTFIYLGVQSTTASNAALLQSIMPVVIVLLSRLILDIRVSAYQMLGILVSLAGVLTIIARGELALLLGLDFVGGDLWVLAAVLSWALYSTLLKRLPEGIAGLQLLGYTVILGLIGIAPLYAWELASGISMQLNGVTLATVAYVAIFPSLLAYLFWNRAVSQVGANRAGQFIHLMPVFGTLLSVIFLGERLFAYHLAGILAVALGIYLATARRLRRGS